MSEFQTRDLERKELTMTTIQNDSYRIFVLGIVIAVLLGLMLYGLIDQNEAKNAIMEENRQLRQQLEEQQSQNGRLNSQVLACEGEVRRLSQVEKENTILRALNLEQIEKLIRADNAIRSCQAESVHMLGVLKDWQLAEVKAQAPVSSAEPTGEGSPLEDSALWLPVVLLGLISAQGTYLALRKCSLKFH